MAVKSPEQLAHMDELTINELVTIKQPLLTTGELLNTFNVLIPSTVKVQVRDAERNLRSYFRVAIIRTVSKPRT
jgi:hypothetical protein